MDDLTPGPRDHVVTASLQGELVALRDDQPVTKGLDSAEGPHRLARHAMLELRRYLETDDSAVSQTEKINRILREFDANDAEIVVPPRVLEGIKSISSLGDVVPLAAKPATPFSQSDLLVNAEGQPNVGSELRAELASADSVDLLCAFVIWSGVRHLREALAEVHERGGKIRVITTTYMGATEKKAIDELVKLGAEVHVALDARTTKLHAKAWLLERSSGLTTAFVGSSNLSHTALFDGLEWNVRLSSSDAGHVIDRVRMMFATHWASEHFTSYDPERDGAELERALHEHNRRSLGEATISFAGLDVRPYPHQQRMLENLMIERDRHDRHQNLVVAATGTGKTVVAALDYKQLVDRADGRRLSLLFVAHREQILQQSLATYRAVLRDGSFGEIHGDGRIAGGQHVFAMIQSLQRTRLDAIDPDAFDVVVIDEFHHASAPTYDRLLERLQPKELLGLTATPERLDGTDVTARFGGRIAAELRLWEAIDQGFLVPFQYFGVADGTDLTQLAWRRGGYVTEALSNLLTGDDVRVAKLLESLRNIVYDVGTMKALGFCVSKEHARYMARKFIEAGLPSVALTGDDSSSDRKEALRQLQHGELRCIFSVEVLGEGVDVPDVDCILLLRPTASATVFSQQLGRGLRRAERKSHLTVIDLIGQHRKEFRFEDRLRAILDPRRGRVLEQVAADFPFLPPGCSIDLDRQSQELILANLRSAVQRSRWAAVVADVKLAADGTTLNEFLAQFDRRLEDVYSSNRSWTQLRRDAGHEVPGPIDATQESAALRTLGRLTHIDDPERVAFYRSILEATTPPRENDHDLRHRRLLTMLAWGLASGSSGADSVSEFFAKLWPEAAVREELIQLLEVVDQRSRTRQQPRLMPAEIPLAVHARYSRQEIVAALGSGSGVKPKVTQGGILWVQEAQSDVFFIDLHKSERDYSPTTMYRDYAISSDLFHWESQSRQSPGMPTVQRYINHQAEGTRVLLFVRERKQFALGTQPFTFLGPATYVSHQGEKPVAFTWRLPIAMPEQLFEVARTVAAA